MKSVSFLLHSEHGFSQAPLEEISQNEYLRILDETSDSKILVGAGVSEVLDDDCASGACPVR